MAEGEFQFNVTRCGLLVPLRASVTVGFVDELLTMVNWPFCEPVVVGLYMSVSSRVWPGLRVAGKVTGEREKPAPVTEADFTVTAAFPVEVRVTICVV